MNDASHLAAIATAICLAADPPGQGPAELVERLAGPNADEAEQLLRRLGPAAVDALILAGETQPAIVRTRCLAMIATMGPRAGDVVERVFDAYAGEFEQPEEFIAFLDALAATMPYCAALRREKLATGRPGAYRFPASWMDRASRKRVRFKGRMPAELVPRLRLAQGRNEVRAYFLIGPDSSSAELVAALDHRQPLLRELAAELLGLRGRAAIDTVPHLAQTLRREHTLEVPNLQTFDHTAVVHESAARAVLAIAPDHLDSAPAHGWRLRHGSDAERYASAAALAGLGPRAAEAVPALIEALDLPDTRCRLESVVALGAIGPAAKDALPRLRELATGDEPGLAKRCAAAIRAIEH